MKGFGPIGERIEVGIKPPLPIVSPEESAAQAEAARKLHEKRVAQAGALSGRRVVQVSAELGGQAEAPQAELPAAPIAEPTE